MLHINLAAISMLFFFLAASSSFAQNPQAGTTQPPAKQVPSVSPFDKKNFLPVCSTEKVNGNCFINIDRRFPISMPTYQMHRGSHITVYVFHPFAFEALTLDAGIVQAFQGSDQIAALLTAATPIGKGAVWSMIDSAMKLDKVEVSIASMEDLNLKLAELETQPALISDAERAKQILAELQHLNDLLTQALAPISHYFAETNTIYAQIREIESAAPRAVADVHNTLLRGPGVPPITPDPWNDYPAWREYMMAEITQQGNDTTALLDRLPGQCQKRTDPKPPLGPWLPSARSCHGSAASEDSQNPLAIPSSYDTHYLQMTNDLAQLPQNKPDTETYAKIQGLKTQLEERKKHVAQAIVSSESLLPGLMGKITNDMEALIGNVGLASPHDSPPNPVELGVIPGPVPPDQIEKQILAPYKALAPQMVYTVNAQNKIANSLIGLPTATQKQAIVTITIVYATPKFEVSAGAFLSWLPNPTFLNHTDVSVVGGVPAPVDIKIDMTKTGPPLVIPYTAGNYRISPEFTWLGGRRGSVYLTTGIALNPYNTQVEYAAGFSFSWRYLMFSPLYHLGHSTHLTQGEQVGQIWCMYGAKAGSTPPPCAGSPPSPSTKMFWTGSVALGISVRIPTTFTSTNR